MTAATWMGIILMSIASMHSSESAGELYRKPEGTVSRWVSFENPTGEPGVGAQSNKGAKGMAFDALKAGETVTLLDVEGCGTIHRMWFTLRERDPQMLRALRLEMYWDGADKPAVAVPFGDFFCAILGRLTTFENALFASPEGRSFNAYIPMPFRTGARITLTNESDRDVEKLFYDINYTLTKEHPADALYFHAHWRRERWTTLGQDFEILPRVDGGGRFLGAHVGVILHPEIAGWWGEGEVKMYLDGDTDYPTIVGTGTEDYIGTGWGQGVFQQRYHGSLVADADTREYGFYRYHIPEPIYFDKELRVTIQQMGGASKREVAGMLDKGLPIKPVSLDYDGEFVRLFELDPVPDIREHEAPDNAWTNHYREDDVSAIAFFYLDRPANNLSALAPVDERAEALAGPEE